MREINEIEKDRDYYHEMMVKYHWRIMNMAVIGLLMIPFAVLIRNIPNFDFSWVIVLVAGVVLVWIAFIFVYKFAYYYKKYNCYNGEYHSAMVNSYLGRR